MVQMISKVQHEYDRKTLQPGDEFEAEEKFVQWLEAVGRAERVTKALTPADQVKPGYQTRDATRVTSRIVKRTVS